MSTSDLSAATWRKSTYSGGGNDCVEIALTTTQSAVRDSKNPAGPVLRFQPATWRAFLDLATRDR